MSYSILCGLGSGICYPVPMSIAVKCNRKKEGYVSIYIYIKRSFEKFLSKYVPIELNSTIFTTLVHIILAI